MSAHDLLGPIEGVDMATYAWVLKRVASAGHDRSRAVTFAAECGISADDWMRAAHGWAARIHDEPVLGRDFRRWFDAS